MNTDIKLGSLVTRESYGNDIIFKVELIKENIATLKGVTVRLIADSSISDLKKYEKNDNKDQHLIKTRKKHYN